jgi:hypothetical protein
MRVLFRTAEVQLQGMRDMLHDRGGKRKAETGVGLRLQHTRRPGSMAVDRSLLIADYLELY